MTKIARGLTGLGWNAEQVAASRFWLLIAIAGAVWLYSGHAALVSEHSASSRRYLDILSDLAVTSILGSIIPLYALQKGIEFCKDRTKLALTMALTPLAMFVLQPFLGIQFQWLSIIGLALILLSQFLSYTRK